MTLDQYFKFEGHRNGIDYRPLSLSDERLVKNWIASPEWQAYWDDPETEWGYYLEDFKTGATHVYIFAIDGRPTGLVQYWHYAPNRQFAEEINEVYLRDFPDETIGLDISIGVPQQLSKGIGARVTNALATALHQAGAEIITIDPDKSNARAIRAYEKAEFVHFRTYGNTYVMLFNKGLQARKFLARSS